MMEGGQDGGMLLGVGLMSECRSDLSVGLEVDAFDSAWIDRRSGSGFRGYGR